MPQNKGYSILSFRDKNGEVYCLNAEGEYSCKFNESKHSFRLDELLLYTDDFIEIFSVKRTRDGKIFVLNSVPYYSGKVTHIDIELMTFQICVVIEYPATTCCVFIEK